MGERLKLHQILHAASQHAGDCIERAGTGLIDVLAALLIHLDGTQTDTFTKNVYCCLRYSLGEIPQALRKALEK